MSTHNSLTGYFRRFIQNYATKAKPLTELLVKDSTWEWNARHRDSFELLKQELTSDNVLAMYSPNAYTEVHTDASNLGLGGIMLQKDGNGQMRPVMYVSRQTTVDERKYHSNELETLSVVWVLEKLRVYLIGLTGYFRRFIQNYATKAKPLTELLVKDSTWEWNARHRDSFELLKQELTSDNVLAMYSPNAYTEVHTDASNLGLGGIMLQKDGNGQMRPVMYVSRQTTVDERKYHSNELETLSVVWVLEKLRVFLIGINFVIVSDCSALRSTFAKKHLIPRIARWWLKIQEYNFEVQHRAGTQMCHVDALSRNPVDPGEDTEGAHRAGTQMCHVDALSRNPVDPGEDTEGAQGLTVLYQILDEPDWLTLAQRQDPKIQEIVDILTNKNKNSGINKKIMTEYEMRYGRLYRRIEEQILWVVPDKARGRIVKKCHDNMAHPALDKTIANIRKFYWFPRLRRYVKGYIGSCLECLYLKYPGGKRPGALHSTDKIGVPYHTIHMDHLGPFIKSRKGNSYLLVSIDGFTKHTMLRPVRNTQSEPTAKFLKDICQLFGPPTRVITDRGTAFTGKPFETCCKERNIVHVRNATQTPRANGQCERVNRVLTPAIASLSKDPEGRDWDEVIPQIQWTLNNMSHRTTKETPFFFLFGYNPRDFQGSPLHDEMLQWMSTDRDLTQERKLAHDRIKEDQAEQQRRYNQKRSRGETFTEGDLVLVKREIQYTGDSRKLLPRYKGPYIITKTLPHDRYIVEDLPETQRTQKFYKGVVAIDDLKRFEVRSVDEDGEERENDEEVAQDERELGVIQVEDDKENKDKRIKTRSKYLHEYVVGFSGTKRSDGWPNVSYE
ncbi:Integrase core domain [Popillia japonica]|uniref:RNA-directed DNA polymerase n=1 Tax=Popillia japonica TaxID=7064 RepID=A0AAW1IWY0_POPJA